MKDSLTARQRRFAQEYARDPDPARAAVRAGYRAKNAEAAGQRLLQLARQRGLEEPTAEQRVLHALEAIAFPPADDGAAKPQERLRALELLMKHYGMFDRPKADRCVQVVLSEQVAPWAE